MQDWPRIHTIVWNNVSLETCMAIQGNVVMWMWNIEMLYTKTSYMQMIVGPSFHESHFISLWNPFPLKCRHKLDILFVWPGLSKMAVEKCCNSPYPLSSKMRLQITHHSCKCRSLCIRFRAHVFHAKHVQNAHGRSHGGLSIVSGGVETKPHPPTNNR